MYGKYQEEYIGYIQKGENINDVAKKMAFEIVNDILVRKGIGNSFEEIDDDIQEEIISTWIGIIKKACDIEKQL